MKKSLTLASFLVLALVAGCASSNKTDSSGSMGVVGESKKDSCCSQKSDGGSMGVMSDAKADHCSGKTGTCPMQDKATKQN
jgi:hypothetical protein